MICIPSDSYRVYFCYDGCKLKFYAAGEVNKINGPKRINGVHFCQMIILHINVDKKKPN